MNRDSLRRAFDLYDARKYAEAIILFEKLALGEPCTDDYIVSNNHLGYMYQHGQGIDKQLGRARECFLNSANCGDFNAAFFLAELDHKNQDYEEAVKWYKYAADHNYSAAQYKLGMMNLDGDGVPQNRAVGLDYLDKAANGGHVVAKGLIAREMILGRRGMINIPRGVLTAVTAILEAWRLKRSNSTSEKIRY